MRINAPVRENLELKAVDVDPRSTFDAAMSLGAEDRGVLAQRDTFFVCVTGRLKLREQDPGGAELIHYVRADAAGARGSRYSLVSVTCPDELREALTRSLGVRAVVTKRRRLLGLGHVRIHLDDVDGLGSYVEIEAVVPQGGRLEDEQATVTNLRRRLNIRDELLVARAYADELASPRASV